MVLQQHTSEESLVTHIALEGSICVLALKIQKLKIESGQKTSSDIRDFFHIF